MHTSALHLHHRLPCSHTASVYIICESRGRGTQKGEHTLRLLSTVTVTVAVPQLSSASSAPSVQLTGSSHGGHVIRTNAEVYYAFVLQVSL